MFLELLSRVLISSRTSAIGSKSLIMEGIICFFMFLLMEVDVHKASGVS